jgi:lipopolysaccharide transport system ATP-binding protein
MRPQIRTTALTKTYPASTTDMLMNITLRHVFTNRGSAAQTQRSAGTPAVNDVNLTINAGERLGIVGRNGAGKSTLLSLLAGLAEPSSGSLDIDGQVTAVMTLGVGLREDLSGRENIYVDGEIQGKSRTEVDRVIDEIIKFADLGEFIDYPIRTYSTGMKARLAFAMIVTIDPEILIIDETLSVGDAEFSAKAGKKIHEICERGKIVIIVAHSMASIVEMCDRCLWMERGHIVMDGKPAEVTAAYTNAVRREDETLLLEKFRHHHGAQTYRPGCAITRLEMYRAGNNAPGAIFTSGEHVIVRVRAGFEGTGCVPNLVLKITRFDGLMVCESELPDQPDLLRTAEDRAIECEALLEPMFFGAGVYQLRVELHDGADLMAHRTTIFEVQVDVPPIGARPALLYPCSLDTSPLP